MSIGGRDRGSRELQLEDAVEMDLLNTRSSAFVLSDGEVEKQRMTRENCFELAFHPIDVETRIC